MKHPFAAYLLVAALIPMHPQKPEEPPPAYRAEFQSWQQNRIGDLKANWLPLIGLFWLDPGNNTFGSDQANAIELPPSSAPARAGVVTLQDGNVAVSVAAGVKLSADGKPVRDREVIFSRSKAPLTLELGTLRMFIIQRGDRYGLRVKDLASAAITEFKGLQTYPLNDDYRIMADFVPTPGKSIAITNVLGIVQQEATPGELRFRFRGQDMRLVPTSAGRGRLFIVFSDLTKATDTYPGGRFLDAGAPENGKVLLDFNKAYSPPCAFTPYATCPLPPKENQLPVAVEAGEKYVRQH